MHAPTDVKLHKQSGTLELIYADDSRYDLSAEYLRVHSPSAEVRGHGPGQETLQVGKKTVRIKKIEAVGSYALKLTFDDGHNTGIYSWDYLSELGKNFSSLWEGYLSRLSEAGQSRDALPKHTEFVTLKDSPTS